MKKFAVFAVALAIVCFMSTSCARADSIGQAWNESGVGSFDKIELFIQTPGVVFGDPGISSAWTNVNVSPTFAFATGADTSSLDFSTYFSGNTSSVFVVDFYALLNGEVVDSAKLTYPVAGQAYGWEVDPLCAKHFGEENTATPEPSSLLLLGTGLFIVGAILWRRNRKLTPAVGYNLA